MSKKKAKSVVADVHEAIQTVDAGEQYRSVAPEVEASDDPNRLVKIILPVRLQINRQDYGPGPVIVPAHMVDSMVEMVDKKKRADLSVFTGNNYLVQRMVDRSLVVTKVEKI